MPPKRLYPEGAENLTIYIPEPVKRALERAAREQRVSVSQFATVVFEDYLRRRGQLRERELERAARG